MTLGGGLHSGKWQISDDCLTIAAILGLAFFSSPVWSQSSQAPAMSYRHTVTGGISAGKIVGGDEPATSQLGFDYLYRLNPKWEVGIQLDFIYERGFEDLEAYALVPIVAYSVTDRIPVFFGMGVEQDKSTKHNEFLVRLGGEYSIFLTKDRRLMLLPGGFIDWVDGDVNASVVLALGYWF